MIFVPTTADRELYENELRDFLPETCIDIHSHLAVPGSMAEPSPERLARYWILRLPMLQTPEEFLKTYELLLPGKTISASAFAMPLMESNIAVQNESVLEAAKTWPGKMFPFLVVTPGTREEEIAKAVSRGFVGLKPYPDFAQTDHPGEERIAEFLTPEMCSAANALRLPVILHISKSKRFADPKNLSDLLELTARYPGMRLIIAHFGRSYTPSFLESALKTLDGTPRWWYDFSAVTNPEVFRLALQAIPHDRICFGLDNPLMLSRGYYSFPAADRYQVHIEGYNLPANGQHPPLAYQILLGFQKAACELRIGRASIERIFRTNARTALGQADTIGGSDTFANVHAEKQA